jgi:energy-converting hydrogenase Eha subunit G
MPGIIGGLVSIVMVGLSKNNFGQNYSNVIYHSNSKTGALIQLASLGTTLTLAIVSGLFTGWLTSREFFGPVPKE